jgi:hypothetical protein
MHYLETGQTEIHPLNKGIKTSFTNITIRAKRNKKREILCIPCIYFIHCV